MTQHKDIQDPENFSEGDYQKYEFLLNAEDTPAEMLKEIVMTLAHIPTEKAQDLLARFKETDNAEKVEWLEPAMNEGKALFIWPETEQEERDMMALKLYHKKNDFIVDLMGRQQVCEYSINQYQIELKALQNLKTKKLNESEDIKLRIIALTDLIRMEKNKVEETKLEIILEEKINKKIKESIKTKRYINLESWDIDGFHFDGEE